jgi:hypothetical protein
MRAGPYLGLVRRLASQPPHEVPGCVVLDLEARLAHPCGGDAVRLVLGGRIANAVRARAAADRVQLVEAPLDAIGQSWNGLNGRVPVPTRTLFVSR